MKPKQRNEHSDAEYVDYFKNIDIFDYDETIVAHPYMDQIKSSIVERVALFNRDSRRKTRILDLGCGSGQLARALLGLSSTEVELCDIDQESRTFCSTHPELYSVTFHSRNILDDHDVSILSKGQFDFVVALGVLHHIPVTQRLTFVENCRAIAEKVIIADEGLEEYSSEGERREHAICWYDFVITEAERRGLTKLAMLERGFKKADISSLRAVTDDYKVSISEVAELCRMAGLRTEIIRRIGDWNQHRGGMFMIEAS